MTSSRAFGRATWPVLLALVALLAVPALAAAHASLLRSAPSDGEVVATSPSEVSLTFTEPVELSLGSIRVFDGQASRVDAGRTTRRTNTTVVGALPKPLANGTYTVSWRVSSADGHPIDGAFVFHVGAPGANPQGVADQVRTGPSRALDVAIDITRFLNLALVVALVGMILVLVLVVGSRAPDVERRLWYVVAGVGFTLSVVAGATLVLHAATVEGIGVGTAARGSTLAAVLETRFGQVRFAQLIGAEVIAVAAVWAAMSSGIGWLKRFLVVLAIGLTVTPGLGGHAGGRGAVAVVADAAHVLAASVWVGGLATVLLGLRLAGPGRSALAEQVWPRFSTAALGSVVVLLVAGTVGSFTHVDRVSGLWETTYGRLLLAKIGLVLVLIGFGVVNRQRLRTGGGSTPAHRVLGAEVAVMLAVVVVTSILINQPPARGAVAPASGVASTVIGDLAATVTVSPAVAGENTVTIALAREGTPASADEVTVTAKPVAGELGPFLLTAAASGPGRYVTPAFPASAAGTWSFDVAVRRGDFDLDSGEVTLSIAGG